MELAGLPFRMIGQDAKNLLQGRDAYDENPNPGAAHSSLTKRDDISFTTHRTALGPAESRDILIKIPADAGGSGNTPNVFEFFDRNYVLSRNAKDGGDLAGGMRTQLHVFAPGQLPRQDYPQQVFNPGGYYK
jgi:hypothetical protein